MRDSEKRRYETAIKAFADAFDKGYVEGKRLLVAGDLTRPLLSFPFVIDVSRAAVLDNEWAQYVPRFEEAGLEAALSLLRKGEAHLDATEVRDDTPVTFYNNAYCWRVLDQSG